MGQIWDVQRFFYNARGYRDDLYKIDQMATAGDIEKQIADFQSSAEGPIKRLKMCSLEVALNHVKSGIPGFDSGSKPLAVASASAGVRPTPSAPAPASVAQAPAPRPAPPAATAAPAQSAWDLREAEGRRHAATPAVQRALRGTTLHLGTGRSAREFTAAQRKLALEMKAACQTEYEAAYPHYFAIAEGRPEDALASLDINLLQFGVWGVEDAAAGDADAIKALRRDARETAQISDGPAKACVARHTLAKLGLPLAEPAPVAAPAVAVAEPASDVRAGSSDVVVDNDEYGARCLKALVPGHDPDAGSYGAVVNSCDFKIAFTLCNLDPKPGSWGDTFNCTKGAPFLEFIGPNARLSVLMTTAETVYMFGCRDPATPRDTSFQLGRGIIGTCHTIGQGQN